MVIQQKQIRTRQEILVTRCLGDDRIRIRIGYNWGEYFIGLTTGGLHHVDDREVTRQVGLRGNDPVEVQVGGRTLPVFSPVPVTT